MPSTRRNFLDRVFGHALATTKFFSQGYGEQATIERLVTLMTTPQPVAPIKVTWVGEPRYGRRTTRYIGSFTSPAGKIAELPPLVRSAYFELVVPRGITLEDDFPICIHLAATSDEKFTRRRILINPLVKRGIGALILENPYYGWRRPKGQRYIAIASMADQLKMSLATTMEAASLLRWLYERDYRHLGVTGYSMGGFMAAYTASTIPFAVACVPCATGASVSEPFTQGGLSPSVAWMAIQQSLELGSVEDTKQAIVEVFEAIAVDGLPLPVDIDPVIFVAGRHDAIVTPANTERLAKHWGNAPIRWVESGHISGMWKGLRTYHGAIEDAFGILMAKYPDGV